MQKFLIESMERNLIPDLFIRAGIRWYCADRLKDLKDFDGVESYAKQLTELPIAVFTEKANEQHYELPPEFFGLVLGKRRKYSCAYWDKDCASLDNAEEDALNQTILHADLEDGMNVLELGCGWGSLTLAMAEKFPKSKIVALSNSAPQRLYIESELKRRGLANVTVITRNVAEVTDLQNEFFSFDRVVSVEMFEHLRNYELMLRRISSWLKPKGKLFVHIFTHKKYAYPYETEGEDNWMGRYFFTGGQMPSQNLLEQFQADLKLKKQWQWDGTHYGKTSEAWLRKMDHSKNEIMNIFEATYGAESKIWFQRWRVFFMACAELFNYKNGTEWGVSHYLFEKE